MFGRPVSIAQLVLFLPPSVETCFFCVAIFVIFISKTDLLVSQSNWNPSSDKSVGSENPDFTSTDRIAMKQRLFKLNK
jgi:hypothetical protein